MAGGWIYGGQGSANGGSGGAVLRVGVQSVEKSAERLGNGSVDRTWWQGWQLGRRERREEEEGGGDYIRTGNGDWQRTIWDTIWWRG